MGESAWRVWVPTFLLFWLVIVLWVLATPLEAGPDEPTTIARAVAIVRGQWVGTPVSASVPQHLVFTDVTIPRPFGAQTAQLRPCFARHGNIPAGCFKPPPAAKAPKVVATEVGSYPPLYYLIAGLPSLLPAGRTAIYAMRILCAAVDAALLATAVYTTRRWGDRRMLIGVGLAVTPMVLFVSAVINPSSLELCSAVCFWAAAAVWATRFVGRAPAGLIWVMAGSGSLLVLSRPDSPLWPVLAAIVLAPVYVRWRPWPDFLERVRRLAQRRVVRLAVPTFVTASVLAVVWMIAIPPRMFAEGIPPPGTPVTTLASKSVDFIPLYLRESVGDFDWLDVSIPSYFIVFWWVSVAVILVAALLRGNRGGKLAVALVALFSFLVPFLGTLLEARSHGFSDQGRYFLPMFVGMPIVAAAVLASPLESRARAHARPTASLLTAAWVLIWAGQSVAFAAALRRNLVGVYGPIWPTDSVRGSWTPPVPGLALDLLAFVSLGALYWWVSRSSRLTPGPARRL